jgi:hypothetical protein
MSQVGWKQERQDSAGQQKGPARVFRVARLVRMLHVQRI